ncbi:MAG: hypothetical protein V2I33_17110 [Kangiellaceae bacterium]|jgi:histone-lysine N-methyltransferase SETMAR|nr:hypothetical protein [Kangiellaceae bacterium]
MEKTEIRAVLKYMYFKGLSPQDAHDDMVRTLGAKDASSYSTVKNWMAEFKRGRQSTVDAHRAGRPCEAITQETIAKVQEIVDSDGRSSIRHIAEITRLLTGTVHSIITDSLRMRKLSARWVPRMLTAEMKAVRKAMSERNLERFHHNPPAFLDQLVTQDETWVHHFDPESKQQSRQWTAPGEASLRKFKVGASAGKVMDTVFWDAKGVIFVDYLPKGASINGEYCAQLLEQLREALKSSRRGKLTKGVLLLQDNAPPHRSQIAMNSARRCGFELLPHPPYSPDLASSDFHLFPRLKASLRGIQFDSDEGVMDAVDDFFKDQDEEFFRTGLMALQHRWEKCIQLEGDYTEK